MGSPTSSSLNAISLRDGSNRRRDSGIQLYRSRSFSSSLNGSLSSIHFNKKESVSRKRSATFSSNGSISVDSCNQLGLNKRITYSLEYSPLLIPAIPAAPTFCSLPGTKMNLTKDHKKYYRQLQERFYKERHRIMLGMEKDCCRYLKDCNMLPKRLRSHLVHKEVACKKRFLSPGNKIEHSNGTSISSSQSLWNVAAKLCYDIQEEGKLLGHEYATQLIAFYLEYCRKMSFTEELQLTRLHHFEVLIAKESAITDDYLQASVHFSRRFWTKKVNVPNSVKPDISEHAFQASGAQLQKIIESLSDVHLRRLAKHKESAAERERLYIDTLENIRNGIKEV